MSENQLVPLLAHLIKDAVKVLKQSFSVALQSETVDELAAALCEFQYEVGGAHKDSTNPFFKSKYADLESCKDAIKEPLHAHGLAIVQATRVNEGGASVLVTTLMHKSGQWIKGELPILCAKERDAQAQGSAITYARRYALSAITGLYQTDDDGEGSQNRDKKPASNSKPQQQTQSKPQQQQQQQKPPAQPQQAAKKIVEGEEPTDAEIVKQPDPVQQAKNEPPGAEIFDQVLQAGISNGWSQDAVEEYMMMFLKGNAVDTSSDDPEIIAKQLTWEQVTDVINYFLSNKPKAA